jgi:hypothetical protein
VTLSEQEKQVALAELGLTPAELAARTPTWAYLLGGGMVLAALAVSIRLANR